MCKLKQNKWFSHFSDVQSWSATMNVCIKIVADRKWKRKMQGSNQFIHVSSFLYYYLLVLVIKMTTFVQLYSRSLYIYELNSSWPHWKIFSAYMARFFYEFIYIYIIFLKLKDFFCEKQKLKDNISKCFINWTKIVYEEL